MEGNFFLAINFFYRNNLNLAWTNCDTLFIFEFEFCICSIFDGVLFTTHSQSALFLIEQVQDLKLR